MNNQVRYKLLEGVRIFIRLNLIDLIYMGSFDYSYECLWYVFVHYYFLKYFK